MGREKKSLDWLWFDTSITQAGRLALQLGVEPSSGGSRRRTRFVLLDNLKVELVQPLSNQTLYRLPAEPPELQLVNATRSLNSRFAPGLNQCVLATVIISPTAVGCEIIMQRLENINN